MRRNSGQILPITVVTIFALILFVGTNGERLLTGIRKSERQREADTLAMIAVNEQARALNAIASLNDGLDTVLDRAYIFAAGALAAAVSCIVALGTPPYCSRLAEETPKFFLNIHKIGSVIKSQQDQLRDWAALAPTRAVQRWNAENLAKNLASGNGLSNMTWAFAYPEAKQVPPEMKLASALPISRGGSNAFKNLSSDEAKRLADGDDMIRCDEDWTKKTPYKPVEEAPNEIAAIRASEGGKNAKIRIEYRPSEWANKSEWRYADPPAVSQMGGLYYNHIEFKRCLSLKEKFHLPSLGLPKPYVLDTPDIRVTIAIVSLPETTPFKDFVSHDHFVWNQPSTWSDIFSTLRPALWTISEARIDGSNMKEMGFQAQLAEAEHREEALQMIADNPIFKNFEKLKSFTPDVGGMGDVLANAGITNIPSIDTDPLRLAPPTAEEIQNARE